MEWKRSGYGLSAHATYAEDRDFEFRMDGPPKITSSGKAIDTKVIVNGVEISKCRLSLTSLKNRFEDAKYLAQAVNEMFGKADLESDIRRAMEDIALDYEDKFNSFRFEIGELTGPFPDVTYEYVLEPYTCVNGGVILFAPEGSFKSYMAMLMAQSMTHGCQTIWRTAKKKVLYVNLERDEASMKARLKRVNIVLGLPEDTGLHVITAPSATLQDIYDTVKNYIVAEGIEYLIIDSVTRVSNDRLTDDTTANHTIRMLNEFGLGWLGIGHTPKYKPDVLYGSFAFRAGVWATVKLSSKHTSQSEMDITLEFDKSNDLPKIGIQGYHASFDDTGLIGIELNQDTNTLIASASGLPGASESISEYLRTNPNSTVADITGATSVSRRTASYLLNNNPDTFEVTGHRGNQKYWSLSPGLGT